MKYNVDELFDIATRTFIGLGYDVTEGSNSKTDYGHSRYFYVNQDNKADVNSGLGFQVRVSDHSTGDRRILNGEQFIFDNKDVMEVFNRINYWFHPEEYKNVVVVKTKVVQIEVGENDLQPSDEIISERVAKSGNKRYTIKRTYKNEGVVPTHKFSGYKLPFKPNNPDIRFAEGGRVQKMIENGAVELKVYDTTPEHAKEYGLIAYNPLYIQRIFVNENDMNKGLGKEILQYLDKYAEDNGNDLIFGHIQQKANPSRVKSLLEKNGYTTIVGNNDFYKFVGKFAEGGTMNTIQQGDALIYKDSELLDFDNIIYVEDVSESAHGTIYTLSNGQSMFETQLKKKFRKANEGEINRSNIMSKEIFSKGGKTTRYMKKIKRGGITYGKSHAEGGIPVKNQSTGDMLEVEGGEGIVNKRSMASDKKVKLNGKEMTICEAVSQLNQLEGGVQFSCDDVEDRQFIEAMARGGELERGVRTEQEHIQVLKDLYAKRITPKQASKRIAKDHLKEDSQYYSKLAKMEGKMADGGKTADNPYAEFGVLKSFKGDAIKKLDKLEEKSTNYCDIDKKHCSSSIGIDRKDMPQIYEEYMDKYIDFLEGQDVDYKMEYEVEVGKLKPTQENISIPRIKKILTRLENGYYTDTQGAKLNPLSRRLIATKDGYILDGHHRWATLLFLSPKNKMDVLRINANIKDLVELSKNFDYASTSQFAYGGKVSVKVPNYTSLDSNDLQTTYVKRGGFPQKGLVLTPMFAEEYDATSRTFTGRKGYTDDAFEIRISLSILESQYKRAWRTERVVTDFIKNQIEPNGGYADLGLKADDFSFNFTYGFNYVPFLRNSVGFEKIRIEFSYVSRQLLVAIYIPPKFQELKDGERFFDLIFDAINMLTKESTRDWSVASLEQKEKAKESKEKKKTISDYFSKAIGMPKIVTTYDPRHSYRLKTENELITQYGKDFFQEFSKYSFLSKATTRKLLGLKIPKKLDFVVRYLLASTFFSHQEKATIRIDDVYEGLVDALGLKISEFELMPLLFTIDKENVYSNDEIEPYVAGKILNEGEVQSNANISNASISDFYQKTLIIEGSYFWNGWSQEEADVLNNLLFAKDGNNFYIVPEVWNWLKYVNLCFNRKGVIYNEQTSSYGIIIFERLFELTQSNPLKNMEILMFTNYEDQKEIDGVVYCATYLQGDKNNVVYVIPKVYIDISRYDDLENNRYLRLNGNSNQSFGRDMFQPTIKKGIFFFPLTKIPSVFRNSSSYDDSDSTYLKFREQLRTMHTMLDSNSPFFEDVNLNEYTISFDISFLTKEILFNDQLLFDIYFQSIFKTIENSTANIIDIKFKNIPNEKIYELLGKSFDYELLENLSYIMQTTKGLRNNNIVGGKDSNSYLYYGRGYLEKNQISDTIFKTQVNSNAEVVYVFDLSNIKNQNNMLIFQNLEAPNFFVNYVEKALEKFNIDSFDQNINMFSLLGIDERLEGINLFTSIAQSSNPMNVRKYINYTRYSLYSGFDGYMYCVEPILLPKDTQLLLTNIAKKKNQFDKDIEALKTLMTIYKEDEIQVYSTLLQKLRETQKKQEEFLLKRYFQNDLTKLLKDYALMQEVGGQRDVTQVVQSGMTSPTGAPSELDIMQWSIVRTAEFKKWFGDWELAYETKNYEGVSKAINPRTAEPLVLYHGKGNMKAEATYFNLTGFPAKYLGANLSYSQWFANAYQELRVVFEFYTRVLNPLDFEKLGLGEITPKEFKRLVSVLYGYDITTKLVAEDRPQKLWMIVRSNPLMLKELRDKTPYDGIIMYEDNPQDILPSGEPNSTLDFVVFNNNQIKSADNRNTTFLLDSPDFRFEKGGLINKHL